MNAWSDGELYRLDAALLDRLHAAEDTSGFPSPEAAELRRAMHALDREWHWRRVQESASG